MTLGFFIGLSTGIPLGACLVYGGSLLLSRAGSRS